MTRPSDVEVSVIIPVRGASASLAVQLSALAAQLDAPPFVVVLVDNGRNGDLQALARTHATHLAVTVVDATRQAGTAFARNRGIERATTEKLLFCDADDVVGPTWVRDGAAALDAHPMFSGGAVPFTSDELDRAIGDVWATLGARLPRYLAQHDQVTPMPQGTYPVLLGCSFGVRRSFALELGGFDETFGSQAEDNDLAFRAQRRLGALPRAGHVAVAYRVRPPREASLRRAVGAGFNHARLCAVHDAWGLSPSYQGRWVLRPLREAARGHGILGPRADAVGRLFGLVVGRVWFRSHRRRRPAPSALVPELPERTDERGSSPSGERATNNDAATGAARSK